jgi:hypothetical protein
MYLLHDPVLILLYAEEGLSRLERPNNGDILKYSRDLTIRYEPDWL